MASASDINVFQPMTELAASIRDGEVTPTTVLEAYLEQIEARDEEINAYITVIEEEAREAAAAAGQALEDGDEVGPLHGVPVALKDLQDMKAGVAHTFGCRLVADAGFVSPETSAAVERLESAGAIVIGKTNTPEFGHKGVTDNEYVGPTASPINTAHQAGGSSGGSAAAVAAGMAAVAMGSDAGGSIRIPAAACGVFGHKPSFGLVPVYSHPNGFGRKIHHSVSGPLARTVRDGAAVMDITSGYHPGDPSSVPVSIDFLGALDRSIADFRIGYSADLDVFPIEGSVESAVSEAVSAFEAVGATVEPIEIGHGLSHETLVEDVETTFSTLLVGVAEILNQEFGVDLRDYKGMVSDTLLRLLEIGDDKSVADVAATGVTRTRLFHAIQEQFEEYDLLATPTLSLSKVELHTDRGLEWDSALTWPFNWTGHPAASLPAGTTDDGGIAAVQLIGRPYHDDDVFAASAAYERERPWQYLYSQDD